MSKEGILDDLDEKKYRGHQKILLGEPVPACAWLTDLVMKILLVDSA